MANDGSGNGLILVLGGNGKTGGRMADFLRQAGQKVRIGSRTADPPFDWNDSDSWGPAVRGVGLPVAYQPDFAALGALEIVDAFFREAVASGVEKLALLSGRGEVEAEQAEQALGPPARTGPSCGRAGSSRISAKASLWTPLQRAK